MSKSKSSSKGAKSDTAILSKVKDAGITKPAQAAQVKSKGIAEKVAAKEAKNPKQKKAKSPTPESSEDESDSEVESEDSASSSSSEDEVAPAPTNGTIKKSVAAAAKKEVSLDEEDSESDNDEILAEVPAGPLAESSGESDGENKKPANNKGPVKAVDLAKKLTPIATSDEDSEDSEEEADSDSDSDSNESEEEVAAKPVQTKRKAEEASTPVAKKTKTVEADASAGQSANLFVGNLSWNVDEEWLKTEFEAFGELSGVRLITDRDSGRSKGFGYIEFVDAADAAKAFEAKKGSMLDGREINVDYAAARSSGGQQDRAQSRAKSFGDSTSAPSDTLFVGNLSFDADQDAVSEAFAECGTVLGVRLPTDRETGAPKGFGYVTFGSVEEAKAAMDSMQGADIAGRACRLDFSQPRPSNGDSPARGGRGGGGRGFGGRGGGRGGFGDRGGRGGGRGRGGFGDRGGRGGRGGRGASTNRGGFGDFSGKKTTF